MKRIQKVEEGYLLNEFQARQLRRNNLSMFRTALLNLVNIGVISHKEKNDIEHYADLIFYKDKIKETKE